MTILSAGDYLLAAESARLSVPERQIYLIYLTCFLDIIGASISIPVLPYYAKEYGAGPAGIGYLFSVWGIMSAIFPPYLGKLADHWGRRPVLILCLFGAGLGSLGQAFPPNFAFFLVARAWAGIWGAVGATAQVYITDVTPDMPKSVRAGYLNTLSMMSPAAVIFGPGIGGLLSKISLRSPSLADGCIQICVSIILVFMLKETPEFLRMQQERQQGEAAASGPAGQATLAEHRVPRAVHILGMSSFFFGVVFGMRLSMFAVLMQGKYGTNSVHNGLIFMAAGVIMVLTNRLALANIQKRFGMLRSSIYATFFNGLLLLGIGLCDNELLAAILFATTSMGQAVRVACNQSLVSELTATQNRGKIVGIVMRYNNGGRFIGPVIGGYLASIRVELPFIACFVAACLSALFLIVEENRRKHAQITMVASTQAA